MFFVERGKPAVEGCGPLNVLGQTKFNVFALEIGYFLTSFLQSLVVEREAATCLGELLSTTLVCLSLLALKSGKLLVNGAAPLAGLHVALLEVVTC